MNKELTPNKFLDEIYEQPEALKSTLHYFTEGEGRDQLAKAVNAWNKNKTQRIIFTGMGSSFFIAGLASSTLNRYGIPALCINAGELIHYQYPVIAPGSLLVVISQSGESYEIISLIENLAHGITCIGITNESQSTLAVKVPLVLLSRAGEELMTSTKTYTSMTLVVTIMAMAIADQWKDKDISRVRLITESVNQVIRIHSSWMPKAMNMLRNAGFIQLVARGPSMAAAQQGALMFMEGARIPASSLLSGEFRHGPMELVKRGFLIIILAPQGETHDQHVKLAGDILGFGGRVIFMSNKDPRLLSDEFLFVEIPCVDENLFSIPAIIPLQLMVNNCAIEKGFTPGEFIRGSKITRIE